MREMTEQFGRRESQTSPRFAPGPGVRQKTGSLQMRPSRADGWGPN